MFSVFFFFLIYAFRFPWTEDHFIFSLILCKNQLLDKPLYTFPLSKETPWSGFKIPLVVSLYLLSLPTYTGPADNDCHYPQFPSLNAVFFPPCRLGTLLFCRELMSSSSLFPILSFLPCGFLVINTGIGSNSSSATLSEPSGTSKPEMRLLSSAA